MQEILNLSPAEQERLLKRLTHHALCKMRRLTWRGAFVALGGSPPGGFEPYDFAHRAIEQAIDGTRLWNRAKYQTLESYLRSSINSEISHLVESVDNRQGRRLSPPSAKDETVAVYEVPGTECNPLHVVIDREWQAQFHAAAVKELDGDAFLLKLLECLEAEITAPSDIAIMLNTTDDHVNNEKKRLRRKLDKLDNRIKPPKQRKLP